MPAVGREQLYLSAFERVPVLGTAPLARFWGRRPCTEPSRLFSPDWNSTPRLEVKGVPLLSTTAVVF